MPNVSLSEYIRYQNQPNKHPPLPPKPKQTNPTNNPTKNPTNQITTKEPTREMSYKDYAKSQLCVVEQRKYKQS